MLRKATKQKVKVRIGLAGAAGSGKTYSALRMAAGMTTWDKVALIDTEKRSGDLYAGITKKYPDINGGTETYNIYSLDAPYSPERYIKAIRDCEEAGMEVIIIDSITHEWDGAGGILEIHGKIPGNSFANWLKVNPRHNAFIGAILESSCHIITTVRKKQDYDMSKDGSGKTTVTKVGMKDVQRDGFEYELTANLELDSSHHASVISTGKDRTELFVDQPPFIVTEEIGRAIIEWANDGVDQIVDPVAENMKDAAVTKPGIADIAKKEKKNILSVKPIEPQVENDGLPWKDGACPNTQEQQERFIKTFDTYAKLNKWTPKIRKENLNKFYGGKGIIDVDGKLLDTYSELLEAKIAEKKTIK